jgi:lysophospholipase L1-like esterase
MKTNNICIWGDSNTYGAWDTEGGWADRLRRYLHKITISSGFNDFYWVYNLGIPGDTSKDIVHRFDVERNARTPNIAFFAIGINDSMQCDLKNTVKLDKFKSNLQLLIEKCNHRQVKVFLLGLHNVNEQQTSPFDVNSYYIQEIIDKYDNEIRKISHTMSVPYINIKDIILQSDLIDGLHYNSKGHQKIFECVKQQFIKSNIIKC